MIRSYLISRLHQEGGADGVHDDELEDAEGDVHEVGLVVALRLELLVRQPHRTQHPGRHVTKAAKRWSS